MRILFFHPLTGHLWRGIERNVVVLSSGMTQRGHDVSILTVNHPEQALLSELDSRVRVHRAPYSRYYTYPCATPHFVTHLLRHRYDAVVVFFGGFGVGPALSAVHRIRPIPYSIFLGYPVDVAPHRYDEFDRWRLPAHALGIWAHGEHVAAGASKRFKLPVTPLRTGIEAGNFGPDPEVRTHVRSSLGIRLEDPVILTVSALDERKGIQHVLDALPHVLRDAPNLRYVIVGDGDFAGALRHKIQSLGLTENVIMTGARADVADLYAAADLFCLLARGEAGPIVLYEALAAGLPVMTLAAPHLTQHFTGDDIEFLDDTSPSHTAASLLQLLSDAPRRERMATSGRRIVAAEYSVDRLCRDIEELIGGSPVTHEAAPAVPLSPL